MPIELARLEAIFSEALRQPTPEERAAFVDRACGDDAELRQRVDRLLACHDTAGTFLVPPEGATLSPPPSIQEKAGSQIGRYKLLEQIGEGGFGVVFMAEQEQPVRRRVALKIVKLGMDTRQVIARFEAERQALAMMDHPGVAKVLDGGATETGRPYFVMELVKGTPITEYCDKNNLSIHKRLDLFVQVCQAVQHAHQKGLIHRDLKPSNILVATADDRPAAKVIDFGIAKAMQARLTEKTLFTEFRQLIGTPEYMSPEQADGGLDVDTRSDVYSLGVLLYELLAGSPPFDPKELRSKAYAEMQRIIREVEPPPPSTRLRTLTETLPSVAAHRAIEPRKLTAMIRGELDWIVMKALEKDRIRRYETATGLGSDIQRYLDDEPVLAGPPSAVYRFRKFARRNRTVLAVSVGSALAVVIGLSASAVLIAKQRDVARAAAGEAILQTAQADRERHRAETNLKTARAAVDKLFTDVAKDLEHKPRMEQIRRQLLQDALGFYRGFLEQRSTDPEMRHETARTYHRVGDIEETLGNWTAAEGALREAVARLEKLSADYPAVLAYRLDLCTSRAALAYRVMWASKPNEQAELRRQLLADYQKLASEFPAEPRYLQEVADAHCSLANTLKDGLGRWAEAEEHLRLSLDTWKLCRKKFPQAPENLFAVSQSHLWLGVLLLDTLRYAEAEAELRLAVSMRERLVAEAPDNPDLRGVVAHAQAYLALLLRLAGRPNESEQIFQQAVATREKLRDDFPTDANHLRRLGEECALFGDTLMELGREQEAEEVVRRGLAARQKLVDDHPTVEVYSTDLGASHYSLGLILHGTDRGEEATEHFRAARDRFDRAVQEVPHVASRQRKLAILLATCPAVQFRDPARAVAAGKAAVQYAPVRWNWQILGIAYYRAGDWKAALDALDTAAELTNGGDGSEWFFQAMAHQQLGDRAKARQTYDSAAQWKAKSRPGDPTLGQYQAEAEALLGIKEP